MIKILVTGTGSLVGQAIIKCIKESSWKDKLHLTGVDYLPNTIGSFWCNEHYLLPDFFLKHTTEDQIVDALIDICNKKNIQFIFIGVDFELPIFARHKNKIEANTQAKLLVSSEEVIKIANNKWETYLFLKNNNLPHPKTFNLNDGIPENLAFPLILKPAVGASSKGVSVVNNYQEIEQRAAHLQQPVLQELVGSKEEEFTCGVVQLTGKVDYSIALKRTLKNGDTFMASYKKNYPPAIYQYINEVSIALQPLGVCNYQLQLDKEGTPKIFEINARHSGTTYFRSLFGFNEVDLILNYYLNNSLQPPILKEGKAMRYFQETLVEVYE